MFETITKFRRDLHQQPELELECWQTQKYIENVLKPLDCTLIYPVSSSIAAFFDNKKEKTLAFRSDMDALPVNESTSHDFKSRIPGRMHACGHDGHMAMLLGFALELNEYYKELDYNILLIFQPGEETPGGAKKIIDTGLFEKYNVKAVFGTHLWPVLDKGVTATRANELMARSSEVNISFKGKSSHVAKYKEGIDALETAVKYITRMYEIENSLPEDIYRLLRFGKLEAGTARNIVAQDAYLEATLRAFQEDVYWFLRNSMENEAAKLQQETGCHISLSFSEGYPAVINDEKLAAFLIENIENLEELKEPEMISEDFSWYQKKAGGVFFFLGTGTGIPLHASTFDFDESILLKGIELYKKITRMHLPLE